MTTTLELTRTRGELWQHAPQPGEASRTARVEGGRCISLGIRYTAEPGPFPPTPDSLSEAAQVMGKTGLQLAALDWDHVSDYEILRDSDGERWERGQDDEGNVWYECLSDSDQPTRFAEEVVFIEP